MIEKFKSELSGSLSDNTGIFPDFLKVVNVIAAKKGEKLDSNNYRPISRLSNISKLYGKSMHIRLTNFLKKNKILFSYQFGFEIIILFILIIN